MPTGLDGSEKACVSVNTGRDCVKVGPTQEMSRVPLKASENKGRGGQKEAQRLGKRHAGNGLEGRGQDSENRSEGELTT